MCLKNNYKIILMKKDNFALGLKDDSSALIN